MQTKFVTRLTFLLTVLPALPQSYSPTPDVYRALARISADSMRGDLSFLSSDLLEGRATPSRGLDLAALYIAAQFRRAGLQPAGDDGYFQTAKMLSIGQPGAGFELSLKAATKSVQVPAERVDIISKHAVELTDAGIVRTAATGKILILRGSPTDRQRMARAALGSHPAAFVEAADEPVPRLIEADTQQQFFSDIPRIIIRDAQAIELLHSAKADPTGLTVSIKLAQPTATPATARNVAGLLRGSDPALGDQYILLTAHYDHLGVNSAGQVMPGANDDGSGTVSVIEIARALAARVHPKRSILFVTFFGEEEDSLGSFFYVRHPLAPLAQTVTDLNLEQIGRTDSTAGPQVSNATMTGFEYSDVARRLQRAGHLTGVKFYETSNDDDFFTRSDNLPFAERGIPAHTIAVAFDFPDYHAAGDVWRKIDYTNMAKVDRMLALGIVLIANDPERPQWNRNNPKAAKYARAAQSSQNTQ